MSVKMSEFFVLLPEGGLFGKKWAYAELIKPVNYGDSETCPVCGDYVTGKRWLPPYRIKLSSAEPQKWGDFVWGAGFPLLVSDRFLKMYEEENLKGINEFSLPVEIIRIGGQRIGNLPRILPIYHLVHIPWGRVNQDDAASKVIHRLPEKIKCTYCRMGVSKRKQEGIVIEEESWDGMDIFLPRGALFDFVVSERFKQLTEIYQLKNVRFIPSRNYGYDNNKVVY